MLENPKFRGFLASIADVFLLRPADAFLLGIDTRLKAAQDFNRPPPATGRPPDSFQEASERWYARQDYIDAVFAEVDANLLACELEIQRRRRFRQSIAKAKKPLADPEYQSYLRRKGRR